MNETKKGKKAESPTCTNKEFYECNLLKIVDENKIVPKLEIKSLLRERIHAFHMIQKYDPISYLNALAFEGYINDENEKYTLTSAGVQHFNKLSKKCLINDIKAISKKREKTSQSFSLHK